VLVKGSFFTYLTEAKLAVNRDKLVRAEGLENGNKHFTSPKA
jgi:hypothetical protein